MDLSVNSAENKPQSHHLRSFLVNTTGFVGAGAIGHRIGTHSKSLLKAIDDIFEENDDIFTRIEAQIDVDAASKSSTIEKEVKDAILNFKDSTNAINQEDSNVKSLNQGFKIGKNITVIQENKAKLIEENIIRDGAAFDLAYKNYVGKSLKTISTIAKHELKFAGIASAIGLAAGIGINCLLKSHSKQVEAK